MTEGGDESTSTLNRDPDLMSFSHVPGSPSFRDAAVNKCACIPLLSSNKDGNTHSSKSFCDLFEAFNRYVQNVQPTIDQKEDKDMMLIVPYSNLTRPGDWRYDNTPFKFFHWGHGCQRLHVFDGRPEYSRMAHDRVINHALTRDWIDFCPSRRTSAVIGVLNLRDCVDQASLHRAEEELQTWSRRYSVPSFENTHGRGDERDPVVARLFVFDSFDECCQHVDLTKTKFDTNILAFPPSDAEHSQMMDLHLNVVVNDLAVAIFQQLEQRIRESDELKGSSDPGSSMRAKNRIGRFLSQDNKGTEEPMVSSTNLSLNSITSVLNPEGGGSAGAGKGVFSQLAETAAKSAASMSKDKTQNKPVQQLLTPVDEVHDFSNLSAKDADFLKRREVGRREKFAADLCLLAGSPMDAYERYLKAAEICKSKNPDPLWYAGSMEGCAAAHIAMAEAGGYNVDEYLENNFQLPDEIMALTVATIQDVKKASANKQTLPKIVFTLCEEALNILNRHPSVACFHAELLLKLILYCAEGEERHMMCRWGEGDGCYGSDNSGARRWEKHSVHKMAFANLKTKEGEDIIVLNTQQRLRKWSELMHRAASTGALHPVTRIDVASRCARLCLKGIKVRQWRHFLHICVGSGIRDIYHNSVVLTIIICSPLNGKGKKVPLLLCSEKQPSSVRLRQNRFPLVGGVWINELGSSGYSHLTYTHAQVTRAMWVGAMDGQLSEHRFCMDYRCMERIFYRLKQLSNC